MATAAITAKCRAAVLLAGVAFDPQWYGTIVGHSIIIDYRFSLANYKSHIFDHLHSEGCETDTFLSTASSVANDQLLEDYRPVAYSFVGVGGGKAEKMLVAMSLLMNYSREASVTYDRVVIVRFDLMFREDFARSNILWDRLNSVSRLELPHLIDDNFYAMPFSMLADFYGVVATCRNGPAVCLHYVLPLLQEIANKSNTTVNFIKDDGKYVADLSWFYIVRNSYRERLTRLIGGCAALLMCFVALDMMIKLVFRMIAAP